MEQQTHIYKIGIKVTKVLISVRFPCSLTFQLKDGNPQHHIDQHTIDSQKAYQLRNGECVVEEQLAMEVALEYNSNTKIYNNKRIILIVHMTSANGKIPAGSIVIPLPTHHQQLQKQHKMGLDKCPDRNATIIFAQRNQFLTLKKKTKTQNSLLMHRSKNHIQHSGSMVRPTHNSQSTVNLEMRYESNERLPRAPIIHPTKLPSKQQGISDSRVSKVSSSVSQIMLENQQNQLNDQKNKILRLEKEKIQYIKQLAKLRGELQILQGQSDNQQQLEDLIKQNQMLLEKCQKNAEVIRQIGGKEREYQHQIKQFKDELDKSKNVMNLAINTKRQLELSIQSYEHTIKNNQKAIQDLQTNLEEITNNLNTQIKRHQSKQNSYKDQIKKLNEKINQSQSERQKATFNLNNILTDMENNQLKNQQHLKEKEKQIIEERNKLHKKIDALNNNIKEIEKDLIEKDNQKNQLIEKYKSLEKNYNQIENENYTLSGELQLAIQSLKAEKQIRKKLQLEIQQSKLNKNDYSSSLQKRLTTISTQNSNLKQKINELTQKSLHQSFIIQKKQSQLNQKINALVLSEQKLINTQIELKRIIEEDNKRNKESQTLSVYNNNSKLRINQLINKIQLHKEQYNQLQTKYYNQISILLKNKEQLQVQLQQIKWTSQKDRERQLQLIEKFKIINTQKSNLQQQTISLSTKIFQLESHLSQSQAEHDKMTQRLVYLEKKQREVNTINKQRNQKIMELQQKNLELQRVNLKLNDKIIQYQIIANNQQQKNDKQQTYFNNNSQYNLLELQINKKKDQIITLQRQYKNSLNQIDQLTKLKQNSKNQINHQTLIINQLKIKNEQFQQKISSIHQQQLAKKQEIQNLKKIVFKHKNELQEYRSKVYNSLEEAIKHLQKDGNETNSNLCFLDDVRLSSMILQILKYKQYITSIFHSSNQQLNEKIKCLKFEVQKLNQYQNERQQQNKKQVQRIKCQLNNIISINEQQIKRLRTQLIYSEQKIRQLRIQNDKLTRQKNQVQQQKLQLGIINEVNFQQKKKLLVNIKQLEDNLQRVSIQLKKQKNDKAQKLDKFVQNNQIQKQKNNILLQQYQQKIKNLQKSNEQKNQQHKQNQIEKFMLVNKINEFKNIIQTKNNENKIILDKKNILQKQKQNLLKTIKNKQKEVVSPTINNDIKVSELELKCLHLQLVISQKQSQIDNCKQQIQKSHLVNIQLQKLIKEAKQKNKNNLDRQSLQIKNLNDKIIQISSQIEIKQFVMKQQQKNIQSNELQITNLKNQHNKKKQINEKLNTETQNNKNLILYLEQSLQVIKLENQTYRQIIQQYKTKINLLELELLENAELKEISIIKQKQLTKLKQDIGNLEKHYQKSMSEMRTSMVGTRKQMYARGSKQQQQRIKIRQLQQLLQQKNLDLQLERIKWQADAEQQKKQIQMQLSILQKANNDLQTEYEQQRHQLNTQIQNITTQCLNLQTIIAEKDELIQYQQLQIKDYEIKIKQLTNQLKTCLQSWDKEKGLYILSKKKLTQVQSEMNRFQHYAVEIDGKSRQLLQVSKNKIKQANIVNINDDLRQVSMALMKTKSKVLGRLQTQNQKQNIMNDFQTVQEKMDIVLRSQGHLK